MRYSDLEINSDEPSAHANEIRACVDEIGPVARGGTICNQSASASKKGMIAVDVARRSLWMNSGARRDTSFKAPNRPMQIQNRRKEVRMKKHTAKGRM
jgi:hypothetical protein